MKERFELKLTPEEKSYLQQKADETCNGNITQFIKNKLFNDKIALAIEIEFNKLRKMQLEILRQATFSKEMMLDIYLKSFPSNGKGKVEEIKDALEDFLREKVI